MSNLLRLDPFFTAFQPLFQSMEQPRRRAPVRSFNPAFEVRETDGEFVLEADLPGVAEADLDIAVDGRELVIAGSRAKVEDKEGEKLHFRERVYGSFRRTFTLPDEVNAESIEAHLDNGVLRLRLPKQPQVQPRKIPIKVA